MDDGETLQLQFEDSRKILTVSALNRAARVAIESNFGSVWVQGEISNLARPSSGHLYWSLKDSDAQLRCAMFRQHARTVPFRLDNGQHVLVRGRVSLYEARGDFQLIVDLLEEAGEGALRRRFEQLKARLAAEGLFDVARKQPLPKIPNRIGVITSPSGAAVRDVLTALRRRFPAVGVLIYPSRVQGDGAADELARALRVANDRAECDVLILTRGGGSLEDLWAFNEEVLARAIAASTIPVIAGVGHETDFTIADFVADLRAPTPSQAAELAVPNRADWLERLQQLWRQLQRSAVRRLAIDRQRTGVLTHRLRRAHPGITLRESAQKLDDCERRLRRAIMSRIATNRADMRELAVRLRSRSPRQAAQLQAQRTAQLSARSKAAAAALIQRARSRLTVLDRALASLSPLATLDRGYAIVTLADRLSVATDARQVRSGDEIGVRLAHGRFDAVVASVDPGD